MGPPAGHLTAVLFGLDGTLIATRRLYREAFADALEATRERLRGGICSGILEMLVRLWVMGVPVELVTGKIRLSWKITSPLIGLGVFRLEVFDEDVSRPKPDPEGLQVAFRELGVTAETVLYVGDKPTDLGAALLAGVRPGAALWSKREEERLPFRELVEEMQGLVFDLPERVGDLFGHH